MRYYAVNISNPDTGAPVYLKSLNGQPLSSLLPSGSANPVYGRTNPAALQVEFDIPGANQTDPGGGTFLRIWGVGLVDLSHAQDFNGLAIEIRGGMAKGLPLANPMQAGILPSGIIQQAFGNWRGVEQSLDFLIVAGGSNTADHYQAKGNFPFNWQAGTSLASAIAQTLSTALPKVPQQISISSDLITSSSATGFYNSLEQFAEFVSSLSQAIIGGQYPGVRIALNGNAVVVFDGTVHAPAAAVKVIAFQDLIGQPTWIAPFTISVQTVLRADIHLGDTVSLPSTIVSVSGAAQPAYADNPARYNINFGGGSYLVQQIHHYGNFRQASADAWATAYQMVPENVGD